MFVGGTLCEAMPEVRHVEAIRGLYGSDLRFTDCAIEVRVCDGVDHVDSPLGLGEHARDAPTSGTSRECLVARLAPRVQVS